MKPRKSISLYVLLVGVMGLLVVGGVVAFQVFVESTKNQLTASQKEAVRPLDGQIEVSVINNLNSRVVFSNDELRQIPSIPPQLTPTAEPEVASDSATVASTSAEIIK